MKWGCDPNIIYIHNYEWHHITSYELGKCNDNQIFVYFEIVFNAGMHKWGDEEKRIRMSFDFRYVRNCVQPSFADDIRL